MDIGVDGGFEVIEWVAGGTRVTGWITMCLYAGNAKLEAKGVVTQSKGLLGLGLGLILSGS